jgi:hypothetical protein
MPTSEVYSSRCGRWWSSVTSLYHIIMQEGKKNTNCVEGLEDPIYVGLL